MLGLWMYFWDVSAWARLPPPPRRRLRDAPTRQRLAVAYTEADPRRAALQRDLAARLNDLAAVELTVKTPASTGVEFAVYHPTLGRVCSEFHVIMQDAPGALSRSSVERWTDRVSYFRYDQPGGKRIRIRLR